MAYEHIALLMFSSMMVLLITGKRVFGAIGFVAVVAAFWLWGQGGSEMAFSAAMKLMKWYPLLTLPLFVYMGYMLSESGLAEDLYRMFHVWMGPLPGGLALGTLGLMVAISAMNGLSVAGMAIGASIALPELLRRGYDKLMVTGVIQAGSTLGILLPPSVVLVLYAMIARQPVGQLWLAGVFPGLLMAALFIIYIVIRCRLQPSLAPALPPEERTHTLREKLALARTGVAPLAIFLSMTGIFLTGYASLVESAAFGAVAATLAVGVFAAAPVVMRIETEAEVFALNGLVVASIVWLAAERGPVRGIWRVVTLGVVAGLGLSNHVTCVLVAPLGLYGAVRGIREAERPKPIVAAAGLAGFVGIHGSSQTLTSYPECIFCRMPNNSRFLAAEMLVHT